MPDPRRDAFGRLLVDPNSLPRLDRLDIVRRLAGRLQAGDNAEDRWFGQKLSEWLHDGGDLVGALGLRPGQGCKGTAQRLIQLEQRDRLLLRLAVVCGGDRAALRVLTGKDRCPVDASAIVAELSTLGTPRSVAAWTRARTRVSRDGR